MKHLLNTVYVMTQGAWLSLDGECVVVNLNRKEKKKFPVHILESVLCFGRVNATAPLIGFCASRGVAVSFFSENGRYLARVDAPVRGNVLLRRMQYRMADDAATTSSIAKNILIAKLANSRNVLLRFMRDNDGVKGKNPLVDAAVKYLALTAADIEGNMPIEVMRGKEGDAARCYFDVFDHLILSQKDSFRFIERSRRPPKDNMNAILSFVYSILAHDVASALEGVGLDPAVGYLHKDRPGRPSLALDMMEEFRPWLADRLALSLVNLRQIRPDGFTRTESGAVSMNDETRKTILGAWQARKREELTHPFIGEKMPIGLLGHVQAKLLARYIRGDIAEYPPFVWK